MTSSPEDGAILSVLGRIADALERIAPEKTVPCDPLASEAFVWDAESHRLIPVKKVNRIPLPLLQGVDSQKDQLLANTRQFAKGYPANNALLWGARGAGKSSLVKAVHANVCTETGGQIALVEIHREDLPSLPVLLGVLRNVESRFILFCDDLSFDAEDASYKSLKAVLEGGVEGRPDNVIFYATSNRRHLMPRDMIENERSTAINPSEAVEEKVSLSDRFGLWLGFHNHDQQTYLAMIAAYVEALSLPIGEEEWKPRAIEWSVTRGARSGRVAWQFIQSLAGELETRLDL